jgi:hypothetical protein
MGRDEVETESSTGTFSALAWSRIFSRATSFSGVLTFLVDPVFWSRMVASSVPVRVCNAVTESVGERVANNESWSFREADHPRVARAKAMGRIRIGGLSSFWEFKRGAAP